MENVPPQMADLSRLREVTYQREKESEREREREQKQTKQKTEQRRQEKNNTIIKKQTKTKIEQKSISYSSFFLCSVVTLAEQSHHVDAPNPPRAKKTRNTRSGRYATKKTKTEEESAKETCSLFSFPGNPVPPVLRSIYQKWQQTAIDLSHLHLKYVPHELFAMPNVRRGEAERLRGTE